MSLHKFLSHIPIPVKYRRIDRDPSDCLKLRYTRMSEEKIIFFIGDTVYFRPNVLLPMGYFILVHIMGQHIPKYNIEVNSDNYNLFHL